MIRSFPQMAFSLIELMVVIAIVAALAAIATPAYNNYISKSKVAAALQSVAVYDGLAIEYYTRNGSFPNDVQLGWDPLNIPSEYITGMDAGPWTSNPTDCKAGNLYLYITNYDGGDFFADNVGKGIIMNRYFIDIKGTILPYCFYYEADSSGLIDRGVVSGCAVQNVNTINELTNIIETSCL